MTQTVLVLDSDREMCEISARVLTRAGFRVKVEQEESAALARVARRGVDLIVADLFAPACDGSALAESVRELASPLCDIPILFTTRGRITRQTKERARALRARAILRRPVAVEVLVAMARKYAKELPPPVAMHPEGDSHRRFEQAMAGTLRELPIPELLHHLHGARATGVLLLDCGRKRKGIQIRDGYPIAVKSNLVSECLGNLMKEQGLISGETFEECVARMKGAEGLQGEILIAMQVMDEEALAVALRQQAEEKLFEIFEWKGGNYRFEIEGALKRGHELALDRSPANIIVEGVRRRFSIARIDRYIRQHGRQCLVHSESPFYRFQDIHPCDEAVRLLSELDGSERLRDFAEADEETRRALYGLLVTGFLELRSRPASHSVGSDESRILQLRPETRRSKREDERALRTDLAAMAEKLRRKSYFAMLEVAEDATADEIDSAFEERAARSHPDRFASASRAVRQLADDVFQQLARAHETLIDPKRRDEYALERGRSERRAAREAAGKKELEAEVEFQRGEALLRQRSYQAALLRFGGALERSPEEGEYHAHYGWCLYLCHPDASSITEEAIEHVRRGIKLARDHEKPYLFLGRLYKATDRLAAAEKMFTRAVQLRPRSVEALRELRLITIRREKSKGLVRRLLRR